MYKLHFFQKIPINLEQTWDFFSSPSNLQKITPPTLDFKMQSINEQKVMYPGMLIFYTVRPLLNIQMEWVTEITAVEKPNYFIDEQKFGPYSFWHHEHWFAPIEGGTLIEDLIFYNLPFGPIGRILNDLKIKRDIETIFSYRKTILEQIHGTYKSEDEKSV